MENAPQLYTASTPGFWRQAWQNCKPLLALLAFIALLLLGAFFIDACAYTQKEKPINDKATGAPLFANEGEKATTEQFDAAGNQRARATVPVSSGTVEQGVEIGKGVGQMLPGPGGLISEIVGTAALALFYAQLKAARRKRLEEYGLTEEEIAEDDGLRAKVEARASHEVKQRIARHVSAKKRKAVPQGAPG